MEALDPSRAEILRYFIYDGINAIRGISISQLWKGLEPPFLHLGQSPMALYQNLEFQEDQRNSNRNF